MCKWCRCSNLPAGPCKHHLKQLEEQKKLGGHLDDLFDCTVQFSLPRFVLSIMPAFSSTPLVVLEYRLERSGTYFVEELVNPAR